MAKNRDLYPLVLTIPRVVAFRDVPTSENDEVGMALAQKFASLLTAIRAHECLHGVPGGKWWPEIEAALSVMDAKWGDAIVDALSRARANPQGVGDIFRILAYSQTLRSKLSHKRLGTELSDGLKVKSPRWFRIQKIWPAKYTLDDPDAASSEGREAPPVTGSS